MKFRSQVFAGFSAAILVLALIGAVNIFMLFEQFRSIENLTGSAYRSQEMTESGRALITAIHTEVVEAFITESNDLAPIRERLDEMASRFYRVVDILGVIQPESSVPADVLVEDFQAYFLYAKGLIKRHAEEQGHKHVSSQDLSKFKELKRAMLKSLNTVFSAHEGAFRDQIEALHKSSVQMRWASVLVGIGGVLVAIVAAFVLSRQLTAPVLTLTRMAKRAAEGNYGARAPVSGGQEVGELARAFNQMLDQIETNVTALKNENIKRRRTEWELREAEQKFWTIFNTARDAIFLVEQKTTRFLECNEFATRMYGYSREELLQMCTHDLSVEKEETLRVFAEKETFVPIRWHARKDGTVFPVEISLSYFIKEDEHFVIGIVRDIAPRLESEKALRRSEERYRNLFNVSNDAILLVNEGVVLESNARANAMFGGDEGGLVGWSFASLSAPEQEDPSLEMSLDEHFEEALSKGVHEFDWRLIGAQDNILSVEIAMSRLEVVAESALLVVVRDVTDRRRMQEVMIQTEKMMSVGGLAAGMAHEINNPLGIIMQSAENLNRRTSVDLAGNRKVAQELGVELGLVRKYLERRNVLLYVEAIRDAGHRAAHIVRNMLDFSRKSESHRALCSIDGMLDRIIDLAGSDYDLKKKYDFKKVNIVREELAPVPEIFCTQTEIEQVLLNLIKNAAHALAGSPREDSSPTITLRTGVRDGFALIEVEDNGPGMEADVRKRIFEPFFTTKAPGTGTGLGLSVSYFIITRNHHGRFFVESTPGEGTRFSILLPAHHAQEGADA